MTEQEVEKLLRKAMADQRSVKVQLVGRAYSPGWPGSPLWVHEMMEDRRVKNTGKVVEGIPDVYVFEGVTMVYGLDIDGGTVDISRERIMSNCYVGEVLP